MAGRGWGQGGAFVKRGGSLNGDRGERGGVVPKGEGGSV